MLDFSAFHWSLLTCWWHWLPTRAPTRPCFGGLARRLVFVSPFICLSTPRQWFGRICRLAYSFACRRPIITAIGRLELVGIRVLLFCIVWVENFMHHFFVKCLLFNQIWKIFRALLMAPSTFTNLPSVGHYRNVYRYGRIDANCTGHSVRLRLQ